MVTSIPSLIIVFVAGAGAMLLFLRNNPRWAAKLGVRPAPQS